ncbi:hypothetical protein L873DRAFT_1787389 [Choiromyces venosus 120613-1]|uniref:Uncharacterized protein n=1 Tax=Choiromyces venosus 120613-1 TaxID=1336337 RepID=A0A3N4K157_9PEZI|nr:hypothetical protein L873DRAFT_1787389 [Choiromyces venosus 120613-1]
MRYRVLGGILDMFAGEVWGDIRHPFCFSAVQKFLVITGISYHISTFPIALLCIPLLGLWLAVSLLGSCGISHSRTIFRGALPIIIPGTASFVLNKSTYRASFYQEITYPVNYSLSSPSVVIRVLTYGISMISYTSTAEHLSCQLSHTDASPLMIRLIDHMSPEEINCMGYKFNALVPTKSPQRGSGITNTVSELVMSDSSVVGQTPKLEFGDCFDCLDYLCDVAALEPERLSNYRIPAALGPGVNQYTSNSLKKSRHQACIIDSCIAEEDRLIDGVEPQTIHKTLPSHKISTFMPQVSVAHTREEVERIKNKNVFAWIDAVIISSGHISDSTAATSPVTDDLIDLFATDLLVVKSSPSISSLALARQVPARTTSDISILDLDCDFSGPPVSPDLKHTATASSLSSARPGSDLTLIDSDNDALDSGGPNPSYPCLIELPPSLNLVLLGAPTTKIPPHLREAFEYPSIQKEVERMPTVVKVVISAPKETKPGRKDTRSPILCPIISAKTALHSEVGHAAWARWVTDNATKASVLPPTSNPQRQNPRSGNTRSGISTVHQNGKAVVNPKGTGRVTVGLNKGGHAGVKQIKNMAHSSSGNNNRPVSNGTSGSSQAKLTAGQTHRHPIRAVSNPAVTPILAQRAVTLAPPEVAPVTWSNSGLPFEGLASRRGIDATLKTVGYHNPKTVSYKRTSTFNREEKIREQLRGTRRVAPPRPKVSPGTTMKQDVWTSQEADFLRASLPAGPLQFTQ